MLETIINMFITFIGIGVAVAITINYWSAIDKILEDKLRISLGRGGGDKSNQPLTKVFYKFNHNSSDDWINWILSQEILEQEMAFAQLIEHLEGSPAEWGSVTKEAIYAISKFTFPENFEILKDFIEVARRMWARYKVLKPCYEQSIKGLIEVTPDKAKQIIKDEFNNPKNPKLDGLSYTLVQTLKFLPDDINPVDLYTEVICRQTEDYRVREVAINDAAKKETFYDEIIEACINHYIKKRTIFADRDNIKIVETIINQYLIDFEDQKLNKLLQACETEGNLGGIIMNVLALVITTESTEFSHEQLLTIYNIQHPEQYKIEKALAKRAGLSRQELSIINTCSLKVDEFEKSLMSVESRQEPLAITNDLNDQLEQIKESLTPRKLQNETGETVQGGGIMLFGQADTEKVNLSRSVAAQRKWSFVYGDFEELRNSGKQNRFIETIHDSKPCLIYLDKVDDIASYQDTHLVKQIKQFIPDPMVFFIGSSSEVINYSNSKEEFHLSGQAANTPRDLFPLITEIHFCPEEKRKKVILELSNQINKERGIENFYTSLLDATAEFSSFEFRKFIFDYLKKSLLIYGEAIEVSEYKKLSGND